MRLLRVQAFVFVLSAMLERLYELIGPATAPHRLDLFGNVVDEPLFWLEHLFDALFRRCLYVDSIVDIEPCHRLVLCRNWSFIDALILYRGWQLRHLIHVWAFSIVFLAQKLHLFSHCHSFLCLFRLRLVLISHYICGLLVSFLRLHLELLFVFRFQLILNCL